MDREKLRRIGLYLEYMGFVIRRELERAEEKPAKRSRKKKAKLVEIGCPECGTVSVEADIFAGGKPVSGPCPKCRERLYFAEPSDG
jgi:hypothetical protein